MVDNGLAVPKLPLWDKNNNPEEWNANNFEMISAAYQPKVEEFLKTVAPYFPISFLLIEKRVMTERSDLNSMEIK